MKKLLVVAVVVTMMFMATSAFAGIVMSKHDLTKGSATTVGWAAAGISACAFCHTPHNAVSAANIPLWNRSIVNTAYTLYSNAATSFGTSGSAGPGVGSKTCLSCHDGTLSLGDVAVTTDATTNGATAIANRVNAAGFLVAGNSALIGSDLSNDHPIGMTYDSTSATAGLVAQSTAETAKARFYANKMECGTCHDPHNTTNIKFLRMTPSTLCTDCHGSK